MKTGGRVRRHTELRAKRWGVRPAPKDANWREDYMPEWMTKEEAPKYTAFELSWFAFVRTLPCCASHLGLCRGPMQAAHVALSADQKGTGMKVPHTQTVPLCHKHHADWDGRSGQANNPFAGMTKDERYTLAAEWVDDVRQAAIPPESDRALADELERMGIGKVIGNGADGWAWMPGPLAEVDPVAIGAP